ncbi:DUF2271 domain-containing protein [candidate division KSB1 bacterium]|nr:DUF2271 domain-containing protein [candidate division KSB1 bacterium]
MKRVPLAVLLLVILIVFSSVEAQESKLSFEQALTLFQSGQTAEAADALRAQAKTDPENVELLTYAGISVGSLAGEAEQDYMAAGRLAMESFGYLDRAVALNDQHVKARLYRGLVAVNVPPFMGRLDQGITDLLTVLNIHKAHPDQVSDEDHLTAHSLLAIGYDKKGERVKAFAVRQRGIKLCPEGSDELKAALAQSEVPDLSGVDIESEIDSIHIQGFDAEAEIQKAKVLIEQGEKEKALSILKKAAESAPKTEAIYPLIFDLVFEIVDTGYDESIRGDTDTRSKQAFDVMNWSDKAVLAFPENNQFRLIRGAMGIHMPFFVGKLDQAIEDLEQVVNSDAPDSLKAEALYMLGLGYTRKASSYWNDVATEYENEDAYQDVLEAMRPAIQKVDETSLDKPVLIVDFISAFQDQIAPQIAVWIENSEGEFVKTLYVSGFSGHAREIQVVLPQLASQTGFKGVDGVTAASIDAGEHVMTWDLTDLDGERVKKETYTVFVEVSHWPSMKYQVISAEIQIGKKKTTVIKKEGDFLPYVEVTYIPK